jgi:hypothetical protein
MFGCHKGLTRATASDTSSGVHPEVRTLTTERLTAIKEINLREQFKAKILFLPKSEEWPAGKNLVSPFDNGNGFAKKHHWANRPAHPISEALDASSVNGSM